MDFGKRKLADFRYESGRSVPSCELLYRLLLDSFQTLPPEIEMLPTQQELSVRFELSVSTVRRTFAKLERNGYIRTGKRGGTRILRRTVDALHPMLNRREYVSAIGLLTANTRDNDFDRSDVRWAFVDELDRVFTRSGIRLVVYNLRENRWDRWRDPERVIASLRENGIRRIILEPILEELRFSFSKLARALEEAGFEIVLNSISTESILEGVAYLHGRYAFATTDTLRAMRRALAALAVPAVRRIVYVSNGPDATFVPRRAKICREFAEDTGREFLYLESPIRVMHDDELLRGEPNITPEIAAETLRFVGRGGESLAVCANDYTAQSLLKLAELPESCRVLGHDEQFAARLGISSFNFNPTGTARALLTLCTERESIEGGRGVIVDTIFVERPADARRRPDSAIENSTLTQKKGEP